MKRRIIREPKQKERKKQHKVVDECFAYFNEFASSTTAAACSRRNACLFHLERIKCIDGDAKATTDGAPIESK